MADDTPTVDDLSDDERRIAHAVSQFLERRGLLAKAGAAVGAGMAVGGSAADAATGRASADPQGQVGTENDPVDSAHFSDAEADQFYTVDPAAGMQGIADAFSNHKQINLKPGATYSGTTTVSVDDPAAIIDLRGATIDYTGAGSVFAVQASNLGNPTYRETPKLLGGNIMLGDNALAAIRVTNTYGTKISYPHIEAKTNGAPTAGILLRDEDGGFSEQTEIRGATIRGPNECIRGDAPNASENKSGKATKIIGGHWEIPDASSAGIALYEQEGMYDSTVAHIGVNNGQDTDMIYLDGGAAGTTRFIQVRGEAQGNTGAYALNLGANAGPNLPSFHGVNLGGQAGWVRNNPNDLNFFVEDWRGDDGNVLYNQRTGEGGAEMRQKVVPSGKARTEYTGSVYQITNETGTVAAAADGPRWFMPSRGRFNPNGSAPSGSNQIGDVALASSNWDPDSDGNGELVIYDGSGWVEIVDLPNI